MQTTNNSLSSSINQTNQQKKLLDMGGGGGTEAFPDLGRHCQHQHCNQLDFLPFKCDGCQKRICIMHVLVLYMQVFCLEHRSHKSHECQKSDFKSRKVIVCDVCSISIETTGQYGETEKAILEKHKKSADCDPRKAKKPKCPVRRCKEVLTFSNTATCKTCQLKVCLKHRFPADHSCKKDSLLENNANANATVCKGRWNDKFLVALASRNGKECTKTDRSSTAASSSTPVKAY